MKGSTRIKTMENCSQLDYSKWPFHFATAGKSFKQHRKLQNTNKEINKSGGGLPQYRGSISTKLYLN